MKHEQIGQGPAEHEAQALRLRLSDIVAEYDEKRASIESEITSYRAAHNALNMACCIGGTYAGRATSDSGHVHASTMEAVLLSSAWRHVYNGLQIGKFASAADRRRLEMFLEKPSEFTLANIRDVFGDFLLSPRHHVLKAVAECFSRLDPAFKSHDKVKVGVAGLPKRIIIERVGDYAGDGYGSEYVLDIFRALLTLNAQPMMEHVAFNDFLRAAKKAPVEFYGITLKRFGNGNAHLHFSPERLLEINRALAEFYGEVLPDSPEAAQERAKREKTGTAVSKDLAFYRTPRAVMETLLNNVYIREGYKVLEPSCGEGDMMEAIREAYPKADIFGVEVDPGRAETARSKGFRVFNSNFLATTPTPSFDVVIMNPPFCGKHYQDHVRHALKFLKPGGMLYAILPATARYDHGFCGDPNERGWDTWRDLPVASFRESGTNVPTGIYKTGAPK